MEQTLELLAPAGSYATLRAVIAAGADAVYVGGSRFGARAYADNFTEEELLDALDYAHLYGKKVYLTVNTLLKNTEMAQLYDYVLPFYERGLDAVLVQDFGALSYLHEAFPDMPVHTSTQMTVTGVQSASLLKQYGVTRAVMARELSLAEMRQIHEETGMELEAFVHGALCYCYSGQCLMSSLLGGRSGNRGRCAQPCRLPYAVFDEKHKITDSSYVLSLKDLCGIRDLHKLKEAGVYSLKIEGRMKQIPYAAGVTAVYRRVIDELFAGEERVPEKEFEELLALGNRCGFTDSYYSRQNDKSMVTFQKPSYEKEDGSLQEQILKRYGGGAPKLPVQGHLVLRAGEPAVYTLTAGETSVRVTGQTVQEAQSRPLAEADVRARMEKTGDTCFVMEATSVELETGVFLPNGALNALRRDALSALTAALLPPKREQARVPQSLTLPETEQTKRVSCSVHTHAQLTAVLSAAFVTTIILELEGYAPDSLRTALAKDIQTVRQAGKEVILALPRVFRARTAAGLLPLLAEQDCAADGFLVRNYEELAFTAEKFPKQRRITDHNLYCYNDRAQAAFLQYADETTVPLELNRGEILHRKLTGSGMVVYGRYPLMVSAQCVHANTGVCDRTPRTVFLRDRKDMRFPVRNVCSFCYNVIYNALPTQLFSRMPELADAGICDFRLEFTVETEKETREILSLFLAKGRGAEDGRFTNGHYKRGVE